MSVANLVPASLKPSTEQADLLLELAYLATAADGRLDEEELSAFREIAERLHSKALTSAELDKILDRFGANVEHADIVSRVEKIAPALPTDLRPLAFKLAVGLSVADLDASEDESDLQVILAEALGLDDSAVSELIAEVYGSLDAGES